MNTEEVVAGVLTAFCVPPESSLFPFSLCRLHTFTHVIQINSYSLLMKALNTPVVTAVRIKLNVDWEL